MLSTQNVGSLRIYVLKFEHWRNFVSKFIDWRIYIFMTHLHLTPTLAPNAKFVWSSITRYLDISSTNTGVEAKVDVLPNTEIRGIRDISRTSRTSKTSKIWPRVFSDHWFVFLDYVIMFIRWSSYLQPDSQSRLKKSWRCSYMPQLGASYNWQASNNINNLLLTCAWLTHPKPEYLTRNKCGS